MQPEQTTTPFRQLYFIVQTMLMDPSNTAAAKQLFDSAHARPLRRADESRAARASTGGAAACRCQAVFRGP